ncbi:hypothetical protein GCM10025331_84460 [Actinoplanes utahensis]|nr:hypothetical protein Aut01nite_00260 [Actinoplanes utahensis]
MRRVGEDVGDTGRAQAGGQIGTGHAVSKAVFVLFPPWASCGGERASDVAAMVIRPGSGLARPPEAL